MPTDTTKESLEKIDLLQPDHQEAFRRALANLLSTHVAEHTFAQILDGLPTDESLRESWALMEGHPVFELKHTQICEGFLERAREFRARLDASELRFERQLLDAFQNTDPGSEDFNLRLIELVVVACHQIAVYLFELDDGAHKHQLYDGWLERKLMESVLQNRRGMDSTGYPLPPAAFFHMSYMFPEQYPRGIADVVGYWAEGKIFGGVVVFDRGETEKECKSMWIHGARIWGPHTLYPPTPEQFESLVKFLLSRPDEEHAPCPLPIHGTKENRPRWHAWHAIARYHIFRDKYERHVSPEPPARHCVEVNADWPEMGDEWIVLNQDYIRSEGGKLSEEDIAAALARLREVTPSSPCYGRFR